MNVDVAAAVSFVAGHGRTLDRRRLELLLGGDDADAVLAALDGYRNADGGYGWGLEPDLRSPESQPGGAMHAFEVLAEIAPAADTSRAPSSCATGWTGTPCLTAGCRSTLPAPIQRGARRVWLGADHATVVAADDGARRCQRPPRRPPRPGRWPTIRGWLGQRAGAYDAIEASTPPPTPTSCCSPSAFSTPSRPKAARCSSGSGRYCHPTAWSRVAGGTPDEALRPLDFAPRPGAGPPAVRCGRRRRRTRPPGDRQQPDGGWTVDFAASSPAPPSSGAATPPSPRSLRCDLTCTVIRALAR